MRTFGWCHNGYHMQPAEEVLRRARRAKLDGLIVKYGDPAFERAISAGGVTWGVERFAYTRDPAREGTRLADAVDAGAAFAVANCEPNDDGGWGEPGADRAIRALIDTFRARHRSVPLYVCADLRPGRSLDATFVVEASHGGVTGWMPMVYPKAFGRTVEQAFQAAYPGPAYLGLPCAPVIQAYDDVGPALVQAQIAEAARFGAEGLSIYVVETASDEELEVVSWAKGRPAADADLLVRLAVAYRTGALAILDHGTPAELAQWGALWSQSLSAGALGDRPPPADVARRLDYLRGALRILDRGTPGELREWGALFARS